MKPYDFEEYSSETIVQAFEEVTENLHEDCLVGYCDESPEEIEDEIEPFVNVMFPIEGVIRKEGEEAFDYFPISMTVECARQMALDIISLVGES